MTTTVNTSLPARADLIPLLNLLPFAVWQARIGDEGDWTLAAETPEEALTTAYGVYSREDVKKYGYEIEIGVFKDHAVYAVHASELKKAGLLEGQIHDLITVLCAMYDAHIWDARGEETFWPGFLPLYTVDSDGQLVPA